MKAKRIFIVVSSLIIFCLLLLYLNLQVISHRLLNKEQVEKTLFDLFGYQVSIKQVHYHLLKGLEISDLHLFMPDNHTDLLKIEKISISYRKDKLLKGALVPEVIELVNPELTLAKNSLSHLMSRFTTGRQRGVTLPWLMIKKGRMLFDDAAIFQKGYVHPVENIYLSFYPYSKTRYLIEGMGDAGLMGRWSVKGEIDIEKMLVQMTLTSQPINLSDPLVVKLSDHLKHIWQRYQPRGLVNLKVDIVYNPTSPEPITGSGPAHAPLDFSVRTECLGNEITFIGFPYKVSEVHGEIIFYSSGTVLRSLNGKSGVAIVSLEGTTDGYAEDAGFKIKLDLQKIPVDTKLYEALNPELKELWSEIQPRSGVLNVQTTVLRDKGLNQPTHYQARVVCQNCEILLKEFPYALTKVQGEIEYDQGLIKIKSLTGQHDKAKIIINGNMAGWQGENLDVIVEAQEIELNDYTLKDAFNTLVVEGAKIWEVYQPTGPVDLVLSIKRTPESGHAIKPYLRVDCRGNSIRYGTARYPLSQITGQIIYQDFKLSLKQLQARSSYSKQEENTSLKNHLEINGEICLDSSIRLFNQPERFKIEIKGTNLIIDQTLRQFLPETLKPIMTELNLSGIADLVLRISSADAPPAQSNMGLDYFAEIKLSDGTLKPGIELTGINGSITIKGAIPAVTQNAYALGSIKLNQVKIAGIRLENVSVQFMQEGSRFSFYNIKAATYQGAATGFLVITFPQGVNQELFSSGPRSAVTSSGTTGLVYSGKVNLAGIDLKELGRDLGTYNISTDKTLSGKLALELGFYEVSKNPKTAQGKGRLYITEAQLWDVPIFLSILNVFAMTEKAVFHEGEVKFKITDGKFDLRYIRFASDTVTLKGRGTMHLDGTLDLQLAAEFASSILPRIKILEKIAHLFTKGIYTIKIEGTFDKPKTSLKPLPVLDIFKAPEKE